MKRLQWMRCIAGVLGLMLLPGQSTLVHAQTDAPESAVEQILFIARPSDGGEGDRFLAEVQPGQSVSFSLVLENQMSDTLSLHSYTPNVYAGPNGGMQLTPEVVEPTGPTTWVAFDARTDEIPAGEAIDVPFTVTVPDGTPPGEYVNAIAVETVDSFVIEGSENFRQRLRKVIPLYVIVPGELTSHLRIAGESYLDMRSRGPVLVIPIENTGNARVRGMGTLKIYDKNRTELADIQLIMNWVYGGMGTTLEARLPGMLPEGGYVFDLAVVDKDQNPVLEAKDASLAVDNVDAFDNPVSFENIDITAAGDPIQLASVSIDVQNDSEMVPAARLSLGVYRNGEHVEDFVLADSLVIPNGAVTVEQRYLPLSGWEPGSYTFSLRLESVEAGTGTTALLLSRDTVATIEVP